MVVQLGWRQRSFYGLFPQNHGQNFSCNKDLIFVQIVQDKKIPENEHFAASISLPRKWMLVGKSNHSTSSLHLYLLVVEKLQA